MKKPIVLAVLLAATTALAVDLVTRDGTRYRDIVVTKVEDNGLRITHRDGLAKIRFTDLSDELRAKYGYDPKKAEALTKAETAAKEAQEAEAIRVAKLATEAKKKQEAELAARAEAVAAAPQPLTPPEPPKPKVSAWMQDRLNGRSGLDGHQYFTGGAFANSARSNTARAETMPGANRRPMVPARPLTAEERKEAAGQKLAFFFTVRLLAHNAQPDSDGGELVKEGAKLLSSIEIGEALAELFPQLTATEQAGAKSFVLWLTELDPNETKEAAAKRLAKSMSKDVLLEMIKEQNPELASNLEFVDGLLGLLQRAAAARQQ